jgi:predicted unusual protein kinase regulating ubiquinone biosynthesis (AarF/ABC1/UbiB family)
MASDRDRVRAGRLRRLGRIAALGPRTGVHLAGHVLRRGAGGGERIGETLFSTLGDMKAGSLKVGQIMAQASDGLPEGMRLRLGRLFSQAPALSWEAVAAVIRAELGDEPHALFATIEPEPFAGASLGQVHRATLDDGRVVAVKVQYPGVAQALEHDLDLLRGMANTVGAGGLVFDTRQYFSVFRQETLDELDYRLEADKLRRVAALVAPWPQLVVPALVEERCAAKVLTMDLLEGPTLHDRFSDPGSLAERYALACDVMRAVLGPLFAGGLVNADAHPGNFVVLEDGRLGLLDFGAVSGVDPDRVRGIGEVLMALLEPGEHDWEALFEAGGMWIGKPDAKSRAMLEEMAAAMARPLHADTHFGRDTFLQEFGRIKQQHPLQIMRTRMDPALLGLFRAILGVYHALKHLEVEGDIRPVLRELVAAQG